MKKNLLIETKLVFVSQDVKKSNNKIKIIIKLNLDMDG